MSPARHESSLDRAAALARGRAVLEAESAAIRDALGRLDERFADAVELLVRCTGRVCVTGVGKAGMIGQKIQATFSSTGTPAYSLHPVEALHGDLGMLTPADVVIALSKSGSSELVELLPRIRELGCRVVLLTANPDSKAAAHADVVLHIGTTEEACPLGLAPSSSTAAMLALGDALALTVMEIKDVQPEQYAGYHPGGALGRFLMKAREILRSGLDCPRVGLDATLKDAHRAIEKAPRRAGAVAVVDGAGRLRGIVTQGDFFRLFDGPSPTLDRPVQGVMTESPKCVRGTQRVVDALSIMRKHAIDELPVVDADGALLGMIDIQDLLARGFSALDAP